MKRQTMTRGGTRAFAVWALAIVTVAPFPAFAADGDDAAAKIQAPSGTRMEAPAEYAGIVSFRLRIDSAGGVSLISRDLVPGSWAETRVTAMGSRLYYEVVDDAGTVIACGYRKDPRDMARNRSVEFLLNAPWSLEARSLNLYFVGYESSGRDGYSRDFRLLASFPVSEGVLAQK
jgi:hypothetical protein